MTKKKRTVHLSGFEQFSYCQNEEWDDTAQEYPEHGVTCEACLSIAAQRHFDFRERIIKHWRKLVEQKR